MCNILDLFHTCLFQLVLIIAIMLSYFGNLSCLGIHGYFELIGRGIVRVMVEYRPHIRLTGFESPNAQIFFSIDRIFCITLMSPNRAETRVCDLKYTYNKIKNILTKNLLWILRIQGILYQHIIVKLQISFHKGYISVGSNIII